MAPEVYTPATNMNFAWTRREPGNVGGPGGVLRNMTTDEVSLPGPAGAPLAPPVPAPLPASPPTEPVAPRTVRVVELAALVGLVVLADVALFAGGAGGVGQALLLAVAPTILFFATPAPRRSPRLFAIGALLLALAARSLWQSGVFAFLLGLSGVFALAVAFRTRRSFVPELLVSGLFSSAGAFVRLWDYFAASARLATGGRIRSIRWVRIVVPTLVVALFGLVLTAANPLIERWVGLAWDSFSVGNFFSVGRVTFWIFAALLSAGLLSPSVRELALSERLGPGHRLEGEIAAPEEDASATARNLLVGVNVLFIAYNALDAVYLWAGTPPPGLDHTTYAHRGTAWLTVGLILSTVVLGIIFRGNMNARTPQTRLVRTLALVWGAQNFILAAGTFRRISMYVHDSGLTILRCLGFMGVVVVAVGFALIVLKIARRHTTLWLLRRQLDAFLVSLVLWTVAPVDKIVWSFNVARIERGDNAALVHLFEQRISPEGVPALAELLDHDDPLVVAGVSYELAQQREVLMAQQRRNRHWTTSELSRGRAMRALVRLPAKPSQDLYPSYMALRERTFRAVGMDPNAVQVWTF